MKLLNTFKQYGYSNQIGPGVYDIHSPRVPSEQEIKDRVGFHELLYDDQVGKVSVIGVGMRSHPGVTATFFEALATERVNLQMISTSEIRISVVVGADDVDRAVRAAHTAFGLDASQEAVVYGGTGR